jgi:outer membrane receptor protein involved in Fe transport
MASAGLQADLAHHLSLGVEVSGMGRRYADDGNTLRLPPFAMVGLNAQWVAHPATRIDARVSNLLNTIAVMQGDTIAGVGTTNSPYVTGRALPGRILELRVSHDF